MLPSTAGIAPLVRVADSRPAGLRETLECGGAGVICSAIHSADQMRNIITRRNSRRLEGEAGQFGRLGSWPADPDFSHRELPELDRMLQDAEHAGEFSSDELRELDQFLPYAESKKGGVATGETYRMH